MGGRGDRGLRSSLLAPGPPSRKFVDSEGVAGAGAVLIIPFSPQSRFTVYTAVTFFTP